MPEGLYTMAQLVGPETREWVHIWDMRKLRSLCGFRDVDLMRHAADPLWLPPQGTPRANCPDCFRHYHAEHADKPLPPEYRPPTPPTF